MRIKVRRRRMPEPPPEYAYAERTPDGWLVSDASELAPDLLTASQLVERYAPLVRCPELEKDLEAEAAPKAEPAPAKAEAP